MTESGKGSAVKTLVRQSRTLSKIALSRDLKRDASSAEDQILLARLQCLDENDESIAASAGGLRTATSIMFRNVNESHARIEKTFRVNTRCRLPTYSRVGHIEGRPVRNLDKRTVQGNDALSYKFVQRPRDMRANAKETNWYPNSKNATLSPEIKYAGHILWGQNKNVGYSLGRKIYEDPTIGENNADIRDLSPRPSKRTTKSQKNGFSFGLGQRFEGMYC